MYKIKNLDCRAPTLVLSKYLNVDAHCGTATCEQYLTAFKLELVVVVSMEPLNTVNKKDVGTYC